MIAFEYASAKPPLLPETSNITEQILWFILAIRHVNGDTQVRQIKKGKGWSLSLIMYGRRRAFDRPARPTPAFKAVTDIKEHSWSFVHLERVLQREWEEAWKTTTN